MLNIGVSACLYGEKCRYNGDSSKYDFLINELSKYAQITTYCPEAELFGTPRESIRLVNIDNQIRVLTTNTKKDFTNELEVISTKYAYDVKDKRLSAFVFKSKSPSCGLYRVKVYEDDSYLCEKKGVGVFAKAIKDTNPYLPIEEDGRLEDDWLRENFIMQIFAYDDLNTFLLSEPKINDLVKFHTSYKYLILSKSQKKYKILGQIVANHQKLDIKELLNSYKENFLDAISQKSSIRKTHNVLLHIFGYLKKDLNTIEKKEILQSIEEFRNRTVPLIVPIKILQLYINKFNNDYLMKQKFLNPYPSEFKLRSSIESGK